MPIPFILLLLLFSLIIWRRPRLAKWAIASAFTLLLLLSSQLSVDYLVKPLETQYPINASSITGQCVVMVLGSLGYRRRYGGAILIGGRFSETNRRTAAA